MDEIPTTGRIVDILGSSPEQGAAKLVSYGSMNPGSVRHVLSRVMHDPVRLNLFVMALRNLRGKVVTQVYADAVSLLTSDEADTCLLDADSILSLMVGTSRRDMVTKCFELWSKLPHQRQAPSYEVSQMLHSAARRGNKTAAVAAAGVLVVTYYDADQLEDAVLKLGEELNSAPVSEPDRGHLASWIGLNVGVSMWDGAFVRHDDNLVPLMTRQGGIDSYVFPNYPNMKLLRDVSEYVIRYVTDPPHQGDIVDINAVDRICEHLPQSWVSYLRMTSNWRSDGYLSSDYMVSSKTASAKAASCLYGAFSHAAKDPGVLEYLSKNKRRADNFAWAVSNMLYGPPFHAGETAEISLEDLTGGLDPLKLSYSAAQSQRPRPALSDLDDLCADSKADRLRYVTHVRIALREIGAVFNSVESTGRDWYGWDHQYMPLSASQRLSVLRLERGCYDEGDLSYCVPKFLQDQVIEASLLCD